MSRGFAQPGSLPMKPMTHRPDRMPIAVGPRHGAFAVTEDHGTGRRCTGCACVLSRYNDDDVCAPCYAKIPLDDRPTLRHDVDPAERIR